MESQEFISLILYYGRRKFFYSMQKAALDGLAKFPSHVEFRLFNGIALALCDRVQEAIRELNHLKNEYELSLAATIALIYSHKRCNIIDKDALENLKFKLNDENQDMNAKSAYYAAVFLFFIGKINEARDYAEQALKNDDSLSGAKVLKAWSDLLQNNCKNRNIFLMLEQVLSKGSNMDASLCQVKYFQLNNEFDKAISVLNKLSIRLPELSVPLIEKMETQLSSRDWDTSFETALRVINIETTNIAALRIKALILVCREGNINAETATLLQLLSAVERVEMGNYWLIMDICKLFSRICSRKREILKITHRYIEKIVQLNPSNVHFITELAYENLLMGNNADAIKNFQTATKFDNNFFLALCGLTLCQIKKNGITEESRQQIQLLNDLKGNEQNPLYQFVLSKTIENSDNAVGLLLEAAETRISQLKVHSFGPDYLLHLDPDFLLQITGEIMQLSPVKLHDSLGLVMSQDSRLDTLKQCMTILRVILNACPGHIQAIYMKAKIELLCGELSMATLTLNRVLNGIDPTFTDGYLLLAQIQLQQNEFTKALQSLEICLSHNFEVRENPLYQLLVGIAHKNQKEYSEAVKCFLIAIQKIGSPFGVDNNEFIISVPSSKSSNTSEHFNEFSLEDKVTLYLELISTYTLLEESNISGESERLMQLAIDEFSNTSQQGRLIIAHAELMIQKGNISKAIDILSSITPGQSFYKQAIMKLAYIYLKHKHDRVAFAKCFKQLVETYPEIDSYTMLGEAYMYIQEPDLAVSAFHKALSLNPKDSIVASKLGRAYVKTHQYAAAIKYYREALINPEHSGLKLDLAELYLKLKQFQNAADLLAGGNDIIGDDNDIEDLKLRSKQLMLLARIHEQSGNIQLSLQVLKEARENQYRVQKRMSVEQTGSPDQHKILSKICLFMAQQYITLRENERALVHFKECLKYSPNDIEVLTSLARLYMQTKAMDLCRDVCTQILHIESNNESASVMMADISFRKMEFENAAFHFSQLLISQPCYWTALARLIEVMRRSGTLSEVTSFLQRAEQASYNLPSATGLNYCKGLYEWYCGNPNGALKEFNIARRDYEWGQQAIFNMIDICINPDGELISSTENIDASDSGEFSESRLIALRTAERLLKELRPHPAGMETEALNHRILHNFLQMASKQKFQIESALNDFTEMASKEEYANMIGPTYGLASALVQLKQTHRAKNQLKRIARVPWNFEEAEYLERSWLLLSEIYVSANKLDVAESFLDRVLEHNKSCTKAYELAGFIAEKGQVYREAAKCYHGAWVCGGRSKPHIGYKLAYNYMKIKRYADAIDVCQQVMRLHPDYIAIKKDILDKCRNYLRT